ncbi:MAG TPA: hypothetical protein VI451_22600 [Anaerolineales bacterium]|nr:hypothetical protein [Anaerolineales bacterium]
MPDTQNADNPGLVIHGVDNPVIALTHAVEMLFADQFFNPHGVRLESQRLNGFVDSDEIFFGNNVPLFQSPALRPRARGRGELYFINMNQAKTRPLD